MNSEQEDNADLPDESNANSSASIDQSNDQKGNGSREHAKPRRRRRGKKRKQRKESAATCEAENPEECEGELHTEREHETRDDSPEWDSTENFSCNDDETYNDVILRPINVPSAPLNSTQFIIDDHNDCQFYMSFETPNPYGGTNYADSICDTVEGDIIEPVGDDAAYIDIDYQYESPQDFDNTAYYDQDFELSYKNNRFEELLRHSRSDLIGRLQALEARFKELTEELVKENPSPILEKLQAELLELQEKNSYLKETNSKLTAVLQDETNDPEILGSETVSENLAILSEHKSEESDRDAYQECNEPDEVVMSDFNSDPLNLRDVHKENCDSQINNRVAEIERLTSRKDYKNRDIDLCRVEDHVDGSHIKTGLGEVDENQQIDKCSSVGSEDVNSKEPKIGSMCSSTGNSEVIQTKHIHSNSHSVLHCQTNTLVDDEVRTLNITSSELFHITNQTKCSSLVPVEGGMSPSETSVN